MDYFIFNLYFFATWILIAAGIIAVIIKLPTKGSTKNKKEVLNIPRVSNCALYDNQDLIENMCISYRHDFGLMQTKERNELRHECKEWLRSYENNKEHCC